MAVIEYAFVGMIFLFLLAFVFIYFTVINATRFRLREFVGNRSVITDYLMLERLDKKDNTPYWISVPWQKRIKVYDPPKQCVDLNKKGKKYLEAYRLSEDEFLFIKDCGFSNKTMLKQSGQTFEEGFTAFGTTERQVLGNQYRKAIEQRQLSWKRAEIIVPAMAFISFMVIIVSMFVFWGDIAQPSIDSHKLALNVQQQNIQIAQELGIRTNGGGGSAAVAQNSIGSSVASDVEDILGVIP